MARFWVLDFLPSLPKSKVHLAIEARLSAHFGVPVRCRHLGDRFQDKTRSRGIRYSIYRSRRVGEFFVKEAPALRLNPALERAVSKIPNVHTPEFLGSGREEGRSFAIWKRIDAPWMPSFDAASLSDLLPIVDALVSMAAATDQIVGEVEKLRSSTIWIRPLTDRLDDALSRQAASGFSSSKRALHAFRSFRRLESLVLARIDQLGLCYFTHNDVSYHNILCEADRRFSLVDWELASISAPGAGLRGFVGLPKTVQWDLAAYYSEQMRRAGFTVATRDAFFVMGAVQAYYLLSTALANGRLAHVGGVLDTTLDLLESRIL